MAVRIEITVSRRASRSESDLTRLAGSECLVIGAQKGRLLRDGEWGECGSQPEGAGTPLLAEAEPEWPESL